MKAFFGALFIGAGVAAVLGWVMNIIHIFKLAAADGGVTTMFVLRCVGVFLAPLGAILGWL